MADPMRIRAQMAGDKVEVRVLMSHEMETGQRKDNNGNIVPACSRCNTSKRNREMEEWYRSQPFFSELRLHRIRRVMRQPEAYQLAMM